MNESVNNRVLVKNLTLFFGIFLLFTDVFFLTIGIVYDMPLIRYLIYVKLVVNSTNIFLILKKHYLISTVIIYSVIMAMMVVGVIAMGTAPAFQIFAIGMLPCISHNGYLHKRILKKELPFLPTIIIHVLLYAGVYIYARFNEPLYDVPQSAVDILLIFNSAATFSIVIFYAYFFHNIAISSEEKLEQMALIDNLTGLYNRHYLLAFIDHMEVKDPEERWIAILDIDDFKKVNDTYGHNCGDYILHEVAGLVKQICKNCIVCRWGGEEFIILSRKNECDMNILETLRGRISENRFTFEDDDIHITVTIGAVQYEKDLTNDSWISRADEKLYYGKSHGKNCVIM